MKNSNNFSSVDICYSCNAKCEKYLKDGKVSYRSKRMKYANKMPSDVLATSCEFYDISRINIETVVAAEVDSNSLERDLE